MGRTQTFNDGICNIYALGGGAYSPRELALKAADLRYNARTVGLGRFYAAKQADVTADLLIRTHRLENVTAKDVVILSDGTSCNISQIQYPADIKPPCMDLTLTKRIECRDPITLIDDQGIERETLCRIDSIDQSEFFQASQSGLKPQLKAILYPENYRNERIARLSGERLAVYRTHVGGNELTELYLSEKVGLNED